MAVGGTKTQTHKRQRETAPDAAIGIQQEAAAIVELEALRARFEEVEADLAGARAELAEERDLNRCISIREAAKQTGVSHDYLYTHRDKFPFIVQMGTRWVANVRKLRECTAEGVRFEEPTPPPMTLGTAERRRRRSSRSWS